MPTFSRRHYDTCYHAAVTYVCSIVLPGFCGKIEFLFQFCQLSTWGSRNQTIARLLEPKPYVERESVGGIVSFSDRLLSSIRISYP